MHFLTRKTTLAATAVLTIVLLFFVFPNLPLPGTALDSTFGYDSTVAYEVISAYGEDGRTLYIWFSLTLDVLLPIAYVCLGLGLLRLLRPNTVLLLVFPILTGCLDLLENAQIIVLMLQYPDLSDSQIALASLTTQWKFVLFGSTAGLILVLTVMGFYKAWRSVR